MNSYESGDSKIWSLLIIFFLFILSGVGFYLYANKYHKIVSPPTENPDPVGIEQQIANLHRITGSENTNSVEEQQEITASSLPVELKSLLMPNYYNLSIQSVIFTDGKSGFIINFKVSSLIYLSQQYYSKVIFNNGWTMVSAIFNQESGLTQMNNNKFTVSVEQRVLDRQNISISINVTEEK